ncbi:MAG TPA: RagB/SusD family nutrient uptake outer membrane protein [Cyclobacteriaceae bacterium]
MLRKKSSFPGSEARLMIDASDVDIDFILDERSRELAGEQMRWFDLKRTDKLIERSAAAVNPPSITCNGTTGRRLPERLLLVRNPTICCAPIPQNQLDRVTSSGSESYPQNPGYN